MTGRRQRRRKPLLDNFKDKTGYWSLREEKLDRTVWNCLLKHLTEANIEGSVEVTRMRRRRRKPLLDNLKEKTGYWRLREETLDCTVWSSDVGRDCEPVLRQTTERMNESINQRLLE